MSILDFLKQLPTDGTYGQEDVVKRILEPGMKYSSFDLSAATDRLPIEIQKDVLSLFIGKKMAHL